MPVIPEPRRQSQDDPRFQAVWATKSDSYSKTQIQTGLVTQAYNLSCSGDRSRNIGKSSPRWAPEGVQGLVT